MYGDFEKVKVLIDAYDQVQSDTANDFEYFTKDVIRMSKSVASAVSVHSSKSQSDAWNESLEIIDGKPLETAKSDPRKLIWALSSIKHEYMWSNKTEEVAKIDELMKTLNAACAPPPYKKSRPANTSMSSKSSSKIAKQSGPVLIKELPDDEFEFISNRIDELIEGDELGPIDDIERQKLVFVARKRKEEYMQRADYYSVGEIDQVLEKLKTRAVKQKPVSQKITELESELTRVRAALDNVLSKKQESVQKILKEKQVREGELMESIDEAEELLCMSIPDPAEARFRMSRKLLEMRKEEQRWASAGSYEAATRLHKEADELEREERRAAVLNSAMTSRARMKMFAEDKESTMKNFKERWGRQVSVCKDGWDKQVNSLKYREERIQKEIENLRKEQNRK